MRSSRGSNGAGCLAALTIVIVGVAGLSAHRLDEYLQAARVGIGPSGVQLQLDLTPGISLAEEIIATIDRNRDGSLSQDEERAYAGTVVGGLTLEVDGTAVPVQLDTLHFPGTDAMRRGEGAIQLQSTATLARLSPGRHQLLFRNSHHRDRSVYLANALVPESNRVAVTAQRRDGDQSELTIDFVMGAAPATSPAVWFCGGIAAVMVVSVLRRRRPRSRIS